MAENLVFNLEVDNSKAVQSVNSFFDSFEKGSAQAKSKLNAAFNQTLQTQVKVEFKDGKLVAKEIQNIRQESNRLGEAYKAVNGQLGKTPNQLKKQSQILRALLGDTQKFKNGTRQVTEEFKTLTARIKKVSKEMERVGQSTGILDRIGARFALIQTAANLATTGVLKIVEGIAQLGQTAMEMETLALQMEAFTGGAEQADAAFAQFVKIAAASPLDLKQVANAGKIMMAFGMSTEEAMKATEQLAIVSAGTGGDINLLARNMGQIVAQGRAYTRDLTQFAIQGIPIWEQLSVVTGKNVRELKDMATNGRITGREVGAALELMTAKGTNLRESADRMQETFAGRFAKITASVQNLSKEFISSFNLIDQSLGGVVSGSMKLFAEGIDFIAGNMDALMMTLAALVAGISAFAAVMIVLNWGAIASAISAIVLAVQGWVAAQTALNIAQAFFAGLTGNWIGIAAGVAAAGIAVAVVSGNLNRAKEETLALQGEIANTGTATGELSEKAQEYAEKVGNGEAVEEYKMQQEQADRINQELERAIEILERQKEARNQAFEDEQENIRMLIDAEKDKIDQAKEAMEEAKAAVRIKYDEEKSQLQETLALIREKYDEEIGLLREKTPAETALYELQKKKLQSKLLERGLDREAALSLKARLERMNANEKIQSLLNERKGKEADVTKIVTELEKERQTALEEIEEAYERTGGAAEEQQKKLQGQLKESEDAQKLFNKEVEKAVTEAGNLNESVRTTSKAIGIQIGEVSRLAGEYRAAAQAAAAMAASINAANRARADRARANRGEAGSGSTNSGVRASGGRVSGGSSYTVNELGKEAFLSASGALSMINAPAWGTWRAPSSGTVIPAHLTSQLNVPSGGVNINKTSGASAASGGGMSMSKMVSAIAEVLGGDNVTNNVTIQSANTNQTASDVMVQLAKLKRLRYN